MTSAVDAAGCERAAIRAYLRGADDECVKHWEAAHRAGLDAGNPAESARYAFWLGLILMVRGQTARAGGWFTRAADLIAQAGTECPASGYLLIPRALAALDGGDPARLAAERVGATGSVIGIDIAADMIDVAKSVPAPGGASIQWRVADATSIPLPDGSVDVVLCQMGLMFMENRAAAIGEMRRVLASSGRLAINTPGRIQPLFDAMERAIVDHISPDLGGFVGAVFSLHDPDVIAALLREGGLRDASATISTSTLRLPPPAEFLWQYTSLTPMATFIHQAPEGAKAAMEKQFVDSVQAHIVDGETVVEQPMVIATARA